MFEFTAIFAILATNLSTNIHHFTNINKHIFNYFVKSLYKFFHYGIHRRQNQSYYQSF